VTTLQPLRRPSRDSVIDLLSHLVAIDSINPSLVPGAAGEKDIADFVSNWLKAASIDVEIQEIVPGRPNVIGRIRGTGGRSLMLNAHLDTVGVQGMNRPFQPTVDGDRLLGRGAYDMKAGLAAIMLAAQIVGDAGGAGGDLIVTAVVDEEYASLGTQGIITAYSADAAIVTEPTALRLCTAHKGFAWLSIETLGRAAHGSRPDLGVDAIAHMGRVLLALEGLGRSLSGGSGHPLLGSGSVHASLIEGGQELSSYPERCRLKVERRTIPGETRELVSNEVRSLLAELGRDDPLFSAESDLFLWRDPFEVGSHEDIVSVLSGAAQKVTGSVPEIYGDTPWMDAALLSTADIPTVVFGPGGAGAHAIEEYASIEQVALCAEILARTALEFAAGS
jgi:acetylornithine deacetylase